MENENGPTPREEMTVRENVGPAKDQLLGPGTDHSGVAERRKERSTGHSCHALQVRIGVSIERVRDDWWQTQVAKAVPVVTGLVRHQNDGVGTVSSRLLERSARVLVVTRGTEPGLSVGVVLTYVAVGVEKYTQNLLVGIRDGLHVPLRNHAAIVLHRTGVVDDDHDPITRHGLNGSRDRRRGCRRRNTQNLSDLERVGPDHSATLDDH